MSDPASESNDTHSSSQEAQKPQIEPIRMPTVEEIRGQDIWNNCAVRSVVSGVMGMFLYKAWWICLLVELFFVSYC